MGPGKDTDGTLGPGERGGRGWPTTTAQRAKCRTHQTVQNTGLPTNIFRHVSQVAPVRETILFQCSASRRQMVDRQLGGDQTNGARPERIVDVVLMLLLRRILWLLVVVLLLLELRMSLVCLCRVWHRTIAWMMPRFGFSSSVTRWHVLRAMLVMSRKVLLLRFLSLSLCCPCLKLSGLKLAGLGRSEGFPRK